MPRAKGAASSRLGRPSVAETDRLNARLLQAARDVFLQEGFKRASMDRICEVAGTTKRTLYRKYPDKESLLLAVIDSHVLSASVPAVTPNATWTLARNLTHAADVLLEWMLSEELIRMARLSVEVHELLRPEHHARNAALHRAVIGNIEAALKVDRPGMSDRDCYFYADAFTQLIAASRHMDTMQGKRPYGYDSEDRASTRRSIRLFLEGWSGI